jgi:hypothetical protein
MNSLTTSQRAVPRVLLDASRRDCQQRTLRSPQPIKEDAASENLLDDLKHPALIRFIEAVMQEPECERVLNAPLDSANLLISPPIQRRRAAAWSTLLYRVQSRIQADVIYAATVMLGLQNLMKAARQSAADGNGFANCGQDDMFRSIVRSALYKLEAEAPIHANLLRIALNWGNQDEMLDEEAHRMQSIVRQSARVCAVRLQLMQRSRAASCKEVVNG